MEAVSRRRWNAPGARQIGRESSATVRDHAEAYIRDVLGMVTAAYERCQRSHWFSLVTPTGLEPVFSP